MIHLLIAIIYISFISLGLPDGLLGSAWPSMYEGLGVPVSYAGVLAMLISFCTIISALVSERLISKLGTGLTTAVSVGMTAVALFGFSVSSRFWMLCLWGIPYGLGAGSVDAALNNYVALHYKSRQMSWLHCFWGVGCSVGPYIMSHFLANGAWNGGYRAVALIQVVLTAIILISLPLWKKKAAMTVGATPDEEKHEPIGIINALKIKGVKQVLAAFCFYCAAEGVAGLWAVSYIVFAKGMDAAQAAKLGSLFYLGITLGRFLAGFVTEKVNDKNMIRLGSGIVVLGVLLMCLPLGNMGAFIGLLLIGLGCAPIYPCIVHATPSHFGRQNSQAIIGIQMASAYVGSTFAPPIFGFVSKLTGMWIFPIVLGIFVVGWIWYSERLNKICG